MSGDDGVAYWEPESIPPPTSRVVKNGSKILATIFGGMPTPLSDNSDPSHTL